MNFKDWQKSHNNHHFKAVSARTEIRRLIRQIQNLTSDDTIAFDTETDGLTNDRELVLLQVGFHDNTYLIRPSEASKVFKALLDTEANIIAHNLSFDLVTMIIHDATFKPTIEAKLRSNPSKFICTMTFSRILEGNAMWNRHGLNAVAERYDCYVKSDESMSTYALRENQPTLIPPLDHPDFLWYAATDIVMLLDIYSHMNNEANENQRELLELECVFHVLAGLMCHKGIRIDLAKLDEFATKLNNESVRLLSELEVNYNVELKSWHNRSDLANAIKQLGGVFPEPEDEEPKVNKKALKKVRHDPDCSPEASKFITEFLKAKSAVSDATKIPGYKALAEANKDTGAPLIHANFRPIGTVTGRTSCNTPNLQNVRKRGELSPRRLFIPNDNHKLASCDYSGIELRVLAWLAKDSVLAGHIAGGYDMHQAMADYIDTDRFTAKCAVFGMLYGEGTKSRSENYNLTYEQSEGVAMKFMSTYEASAWFLHNSVANAKMHFMAAVGKDSQVEIGTGWKCNVRRFDDGGFPAYLAANYHIQGWAAWCLKRASVKLFQADLWKYCVMSVHDEFIFEFPEDQVEDLLQQVMDVCTLTVYINGQDFKFELDGEVFPSFWGS